MNEIAIGLLVVCGLAILVLPRRLVPVAILIGSCYVTRAQGIDFGPFSFTVVRILVVVGVLRVLLRGEWLNSRLHGLDGLLLLWGTWMLLSVAFHRDPADQVIERLGLVFDAWGAYFVFRYSCRTWRDVTGLCRLLAVVLAPIAVAMVIEKATAHNLFAFFGGVPAVPTIRNGNVRAQGPFAHAILAGTIGAVCLPLVLSVWRRSRAAALLGAAACLAIVVSSTSSGPLLSAGAAVGALLLWPYRQWTRVVRWGAVVAYVALSLVMNDPAYYIMARIDLSGGSTGWHRARLIESSIEHLSEWWMAGTDYTRHWMATGVSWSPDHTDITNHYLQMGVMGGLPLMVLFIALVAAGFTVISQCLRQSPRRNRFALWALGASWFAHAVTALAVSYFDQSAVFLYLTLGLIGAAQTCTVTAKAARKSSTEVRLKRRELDELPADPVFDTGSAT
ncbi:MAG: hypothetical protein GEU99_26485 [Luteitalea sp.]|nr:hypothetical protein [Luteitalea sp.]